MLLHYLGKLKAENCILLLKNAECRFANRHTKHIHITTWSHKNHHSFAQKPAVCTKQDLGREYSMPHTHRSGSCSLSSLKWKVNGQYWWDILLSQQILAVIQHIVDDYVIYHAPAHGARNMWQKAGQQAFCHS